MNLYGCWTKQISLVQCSQYFYKYANLIKKVLFMVSIILNSKKKYFCKLKFHTAQLWTITNIEHLMRHHNIKKKTLTLCIKTVACRKSSSHKYTNYKRITMCPPDKVVNRLYNLLVCYFMCNHNEVFACCCTLWFYLSWCFCRYNSTEAIGYPGKFFIKSIEENNTLS